MAIVWVNSFWEFTFAVNMQLRPEFVIKKYKYSMKELSKKIVFVCLFFIVKTESFGQVADKQQLFDSLIVNTWKISKLKVKDSYVEITEEQKAAKMIFLQNHIAKNISAVSNETGKWKINAESMTLETTFGEKFGAEPVVFKISKLEKAKLVLELKGSHASEQMVFEMIPE
jgi:hypothetical protein